MAKRSPSRKQTAQRRSLAAIKGQAKRAAEKAWKHLAPAARKGRKKDSFITRSVAARVGRAKTQAPSKRVVVPRKKVELPKPTARRVRKRKPREPEPVPKRSARRRRSKYAVSADYRSRKAGSAVTIQIAATGPENANKADAISATETKINTGRSPQGWNIRIINWRGSEWEGEPVASDARLTEAWRTLSAPLALADIDVSKVGDS
jgi:hypothetical protein